MAGEEITVFLMSLMILAGVAVLWMAMQSRRHIREMEHRERLAMIERGLIPPPELDPGLFERRAGLEGRPVTAAGARFRSVGVLMIGLGLGLMVLISFAAETPSVGLGIGGAFALLGAAFYVNAMLSSRHDVYQMPPTTTQRSSPEPRNSPPNQAP